MKQYLNAIQAINKGMDLVAGITFVAIVLLTCSDVIGRYLGHPVQGSYDIVSIMGVFLIGFALPRTAWEKGHVLVDILVSKIPKAAGIILALTTRILAIALFVLITWNLVDMGASFFKTKDATMTIGIPFYPAAYALALCTFVQCLVLIADIARIYMARGLSYE
jgi:TRAP-type C4-dicarboxylate transport system permease small subunit